ncbi:uncharacterized protein LOC107266583 isoform X1 [Cephus cinctus]|uniref:Uncharacterized protein LOC107266583 isoform X1 n=1 Tax=Cephus cinctus TaxID=211228 RepID=A0AAJ7FHX8_CEPCN|nr:uncharacterized protein LOC107266583 isoform X1 [Cephus cinctus]
MRTESLKKSGYAEIRIVNLREKKQSLTAKDVADLSRKSSTVLDCCRSCKPVSRLSSVPVVVTDVVEVAEWRTIPWRQRVHPNQIQERLYNG